MERRIDVSILDLDEAAAVNAERRSSWMERGLTAEPSTRQGSGEARLGLMLTRRLRVMLDMIATPAPDAQMTAPS